jgi:hypothetical protein
MKTTIIFLSLACTLFACNSSNHEQENKPEVAVVDSVGNFFPVTTYLKGELYEIKNGGVTPVQKITINKKTDSAWLKMEALDTLLTDFLSPTIDTANLKTSFVEKKFLDETLNAYTFTYDPKNVAENTFAFTHWDVYVDPETQKVRRIYLLKKIDANTTQQLTWQSGKWCKIVTIKNNEGKSTIAKEENITWSFNE